MSGHREPPGCGVGPPRNQDEIRARISFKRWRIYESVVEILNEIETRIDWEKLYDADVETDELLAWGLYLEEALPGIPGRLRAACAEAAPAGCRPEGRLEELEDHLHWGVRQVETGLRQSVSVLSREMVELITTGTRDLPAPRLREAWRALAVPIAEIAGKLRSDLRKLTAFLVAGELWDSDEIEVVLFPRKHQELERTRRLRQRLVETMEGFQGSDERLPISDVIRMWRNGQALGQAALAEIDSMIQGLVTMLDGANRMALYVDSYYRLGDWSRHLERCSEGLKQHLGDEAVEDALTKEIAAILDTEILAEILGEESLREVELPRDLEDLLSSLNKRAVGQLDVKKTEQQRLLDLKTTLRGVPGRLGTRVLTREDEGLLRRAAGRIRGQRLVERLRFHSRLPPPMAHLEHLHPVVIESEDGLKTYLMLLYGQIQNRDLHLLQEDQSEVSVAEKRLAVAELEYRLSRLIAGRDYEAFEVVYQRLAEKDSPSVAEWADLHGFLDQLWQLIAPRIERLTSFTDVEGIPADAFGRLTAACEELRMLEEPPRGDQLAAAVTQLDALIDLLASLRSARVVIAPPETVAEIEDFLNTLG